MANIINRLFGKSERANEPSCQHPLPDFSQYEPECIACCIEQMVSHLDLDIWSPLWWYNTHSRDHTIELFEGNDIAKSVPN